MSMTTRIAALTTAGALLAVPTAVLASAPAQADVERSGACGAGRYEFNVDREGRGFEVSVDLEGVQVGSRWRVVLRHDGVRYVNRVVRADREGDLDVERYRANTSGSDAFSFRLTRVGGSPSCSRTITVR